MCARDASPKSRVSYTASGMDTSAWGAPVISTRDNTMVALHLCGGCESEDVYVGLSGKTILVDLDSKGGR